jgi:hypothetical protein
LEEWNTKFVDGVIPSAPTKWTDMAVSSEFPKHRRGQRDRRVPRRDFDLDLDFLLWAFSWVGPLENAHDEHERAEWIRFECEALDCVLRSFPESVGAQEEFGGTPYETDRHVFNRIAVLVLQLRPNDKVEAPWKRILNLGAAAHYWVNDFVNSFLSAGLQKSPVPQAFIPTWKAMIEHAFSSPQWAGKRKFRLGEMWQHLLGQDWVSRSLWTNEFQPVVAEMKPHLERWAKGRLNDARELRVFFHFLETAAAEFLVSDALGWIAPLLKEADDWFWDREEDRDSFASFLSLAWNKHWLIIKKSPAALEGFKTLAAKLAAHQNRLALEISSQVAGRG